MGKKKPQAQAVTPQEQFAAEAAKLTEHKTLAGRDITSEVERLDDADMTYFQNVQSVQAQARAAAQEAQAITGFFMQTIAPKYKLNSNDRIASDGTIVRGAIAKAGA